ncbi:hypothetical protein F8388_018849 [Cannabis sativa]|uniref:Uncharacterized protein n=1 Tax=Cannabis sativa TaxID=3483 RepID=A0A7J6DKI7_CANSA|nr:hypothetical protein G4B88_027672 [Cannabis sativa]KAF4376180.1 hypothetical protein F8388_018849 [Cannabis sativa]
MDSYLKLCKSFGLSTLQWEDPYSWMSSLNDKVAMCHMDIYMEQEEKYAEAVMIDTQRLQSKLQSEMASQLAFDLSTPPLRWGPWGKTALVVDVCLSRI